MRRIAVWTLAVAAAIGGARSGCKPTGTPVLDPIYSALLAGLVTLASAKARRSTKLWLTVITVVMSRGLLLVPAVVSLFVAFGSTFQRRRSQVLGALTGAIAIQVVLRWPSIGFQGAPTLIAAAAVIPVFVSALRQLRRRTRKRIVIGLVSTALVAIILSIPVPVAALLSRTAVTQGVSDVRSGIRGVDAGSTPQLLKRLKLASSKLSSAKRNLDSWWTLGARLVPIVAQQRQALANASNAAVTVTRTVDAEAGRIDLHKLVLKQGTLDLARIEHTAPLLRSIYSSLTDASSALSRSRSAWVVSPIRSRLDKLEHYVARARSGASLALAAIGAAPSILGQHGPRHYFVAFLQPAESRGLGGLIGAYGELTVDKGHIALTRHGHVTDLNRVGNRVRKITGPKGYLARYGAFHPQDNFQDLSYSPDFPTVADVVGQMYPQSGGNHIDGVLAIDPEALAGILRLTGPVKLPGKSTLVSSSNVTAFLLKEQYTIFGSGETAQLARHDFLEEALVQAFKHLTSEALPNPVALARDLGPYVKEGHLLFWAFPQGDHSFLRRTGLAGAFPDPHGRDLLAVTTQNAANNKLDAYLQRSIVDHVTFDPGSGAESATVTITLRDQTPASRLPEEVLGAYTKFSLPPGTNRTWLSVYTPLNLISARQGLAQMPMGSNLELGEHVFSAFVNVPAGGSKTLILRLSGRIRPGDRYSLYFHQQPMANPDHDLVTVKTAPGWTTSGGDSWITSRDLTQLHRVSVIRR